MNALDMIAACMERQRDTVAHYDLGACSGSGGEAIPAGSNAEGSLPAPAITESVAEGEGL